MYISLEPVLGTYADCYSENCQRKIKQAHDNREEHVSLGEECFNAVLYFHQNIPIIQRTPATRFKQSGRRSVKLVSYDDDTVQVFKIPGFGWSLYQTVNYTNIKMIPIKRIRGDEVHFWQWSTNVSFNQSKDSSWIYYSNENQEVIEQAFQRKEDKVTVTIGLANFEIIFSKDSVFHKQIRHVDTGPKQRWVRRTLLSSSIKKYIEDKLASSCSEYDQCAICLNDFSENPLNPWIKLDCSHIFHKLCVQQLLERDDDKCPLCRASTLRVS
tara:strand:- start:376 stop:1185 length:810 start_codon:yes stop_codon:yes gene_type:complete